MIDSVGANEGSPRQIQRRMIVEIQNVSNCNALRDFCSTPTPLGKVSPGARFEVNRHRPGIRLVFVRRCDDAGIDVCEINRGFDLV